MMDWLRPGESPALVDRPLSRLRRKLDSPVKELLRGDLLRLIHFFRELDIAPHVRIPDLLTLIVRIIHASGITTCYASRPIEYGVLGHLGQKDIFAKNK